MKINKNSVKAGLAGLLLSGCSVINYPSSKLVPVENLQVNETNKFREVSVKSEEEGIKEMRKNMQHSLVGESLVFLPKQGMWREVGKLNNEYQEKDDVYYVKRKLDYGVIVDLIKENKNLVFYHFNQDSLPEGIYDKIPEQSVRIQNAIPSPGEVLDIFELGVEFNCYYGEGTIEGRLVSKEGVTKFGFTEEGVDKYLRWGFSKINKKVVSPKYDWAESFEEKNTNTIERIKETTKSMSDEYFKIEFKTHEEYLSEIKE